MENLDIIKNKLNIPEMSMEIYNSIPFSNRITFEDGIKVRLQGSKFYEGQMSTYYICKQYTKRLSDKKLIPYSVILKK